ncbi:hypothetical protein HD554DRAFT_2043838 [Boletus coccyginus]|nr:hypothetical protein HD554DRAFT_2043838 [Boletus coccyginus]
MAIQDGQLWLAMFSLIHLAWFNDGRPGWPCMPGLVVTYAIYGKRVTWHGATMAVLDGHAIYGKRVTWHGATMAVLDGHVCPAMSSLMPFCQVIQARDSLGIENQLNIAQYGHKRKCACRYKMHIHQRQNLKIMDHIFGWVDM